VLQLWATFARKCVRWICQRERCCWGIPEVPRQMVWRSSAKRWIYVCLLVEICIVWWVTLSHIIEPYTLTARHVLYVTFQVVSQWLIL
jgi:hypothetical protein